MTDVEREQAETAAEGVISFAYDLQPPDTAAAATAAFDQLSAWRQIFLRLGLLGQSPDRYQGLGFGNLSARDSDRPDEFLITASQTGSVSRLEPRHLTRILSYNLERFWVEAQGTAPPSSETLTHAMVYHLDPRIEWVFHCHSPEIWGSVEKLSLPCTAAEVRYGSIEMVRSTGQLLNAHHSRPLVFATLGHTDGVFACGQTARDTGGLLVSYLARALALA